MQHRSPELREEYWQRVEQVRAVKNLLARQDLTRMLDHCVRLWNKMDSELVECRRLNRYTALYQSVEAQYVEQLRTVSRYLVWAHLRF